MRGCCPGNRCRLIATTSIPNQDSEPTLRELAARIMLVVVAVGMTLYQLLILFDQPWGALRHYYVHLGLVLLVAALALLVGGETDRNRANSVLIYAACVIGSLSAAYLAIINLEFLQPNIDTIHMIVGVALLASVAILVMQAWGKTLAGLMVVAVAYYAFDASHDARLMISNLTGMGGTRGVIGFMPLSADTLFLIVVFGGLLRGTRILELFTEIGFLLERFSDRGVCYSAIMASSAIGMVTGQAVANVALSGSVTIQSMKQAGVSSDAAGAIEVVASNGSQLIPPVMGLAGFLIAVNLGIPFADVAAAAIIPAFLFITMLFIGVRIVDIPKSRSERPAVSVRKIVWLAPSFAISLGLLLMLLAQRYSPGLSAFWACAALLVLSFLRPRQFWPSSRALTSSFVSGVSTACSLGLILAGVGVIIQVLQSTGAGIELGRTVMSMADGSVAMGLLFAMAIALFAGLGLPTPAAYALIAIIMVPSLIDLGVDPLAAHFFGFFFAILSSMTPPVAVGVMTALRISGGSFAGTIRESAKLSAVLLLIPFAIVAHPSLLAFPNTSLETLLVGMSLIAAAFAWSLALDVSRSRTTRVFAMSASIGLGLMAIA